MSPPAARPAKPAGIFGREEEWNALAAFATHNAQRATLGIVSGRRRMGKTYLLDALAQELRGFFFTATADTSTVSLRKFGAAMAAQRGQPAPFGFRTWDDAVTTLFELAAEGDSDEPMFVVIDEFPYLLKAAPELASILQREIDRHQTRRSRLRLLLCGSAMSVMGGLLGGNAPLRGRAHLEMVVKPFDYRTAAEFWGVGDAPSLAARLFAVIGGTPAYRGFVVGDAPADLVDFDSWVGRTVLYRYSPLFLEARYMLGEEVDMRDPALYQSVLEAVSAGNATRGGIANYIGRKTIDISHPLRVLEDCRLLVKDTDLFRTGRSQYRIAEPLINFYEAVMRPAWAQLEQGRATAVWAQSAERFTAQVLGPQFEVLCREHVLLTPPDALAGFLGDVGSGVVTDPQARRQIQIDVAAVTLGTGGSRAAVRLLGEAKWGTLMGVPHLERLIRARDVLADRGLDSENCALACFSAAGFSDALRQRAEGGEVLLFGLDALYGGSPPR